MYVLSHSVRTCVIYVRLGRKQIVLDGARKRKTHHLNNPKGKVEEVDMKKMRKLEMLKIPKLYEGDKIK